MSDSIYDKSRVVDTYPVIVIGAGLGGLGAACQLARTSAPNPGAGTESIISYHRGVGAAGMQAGVSQFASRCCQLFALLDMWLSRAAERVIAEP